MTGVFALQLPSQQPVPELGMIFMAHTTSSVPRSGRLSEFPEAGDENIFFKNPIGAFHLQTINTF